MGNQVTMKSTTRITLCLCLLFAIAELPWVQSCQPNSYCMACKPKADPLFDFELDGSGGCYCSQSENLKSNFNCIHDRIETEDSHLMRFLMSVMLINLMEESQRVNFKFLNALIW